MSTKDERIAELEAHLQRIGDAWMIDDTGIHEIYHDHVRLPKARYEAVNDAILGAPTTSLARRDARMKAEEFETLLGITRDSDAGGAIRAVIFDRIKALYRQAKEASWKAATSFASRARAG